MALNPISTQDLDALMCVPKAHKRRIEDEDFENWGMTRPMMPSAGAVDLRRWCGCESLIRNERTPKGKRGQVVECVSEAVLM